MSDTILPVQFFDRTVVSDTPEKRLIFAVLLDAIVQLRRDDSAAVDAEHWIRDETDGAPISFAEACEVLGIEAQNFARGLLSWRAAQSGIALGVPTRQLPGTQRRVTPLGRKRRLSSAP